MHALDKTQIQTVKAFINGKCMVFLDFKDEVLDHMLCDIEVLMKHDTLAFEEAFSKAKYKWKKMLKPTSSLWYGVLNAPYIALKKCEYLMHKSVGLTFLITVALVLMLHVLSVCFHFSVHALHNNFMYMFLLGITFITSVCQLLYISYWKETTSYSYCYKNLFFNAPIGFLILFVSKFEIGDNIVSSWFHQWLPILGMLLFISIYIITCAMFLKHRAIINQIISVRAIQSDFR